MWRSLKNLPKLSFLLLATCEAEEFLSFAAGADPVCSPIYAANLWTSSSKPSQVSLKLKGLDESSANSFGFLIYEYKDENSLGFLDTKTGEKDYFCTDENIGQGDCTSATIGNLILKNDNPPKRSYIGQWIRKIEENPSPVLFPVTQTGFYCFRLVNPKSAPVLIDLSFENPYGKLPAELFPLLKMSAFLVIVYGICFILWSFLSYQHRKHIVALQNYILITIGLLGMEMYVSYLYYRHFNDFGSSSQLLGLLVAVMSATRGTASLVFLLLASSGYGVVVASIPNQRSVIILSITHLVASVGNAFLTSSGSKPGNTIILLTSIPISITYTLFFSRIFNGLANTKDLLAIRKQAVKLKMYQRLTMVLYTFFTGACIFMIIAAVILVSYNHSLLWYSRHWQSLWFFSIGWTIILNLFACLSLAYIFRPRSHNRNYGMDELNDIPLDDDIVYDKPNQALETLRSVKGSYNNLNHTRWASENLTVFGKDDSESDTN